jgi:phosphoribosylaminoimidazole carboxylase (NCAIR synthetase)
VPVAARSAPTPPAAHDPGYVEDVVAAVFVAPYLLPTTVRFLAAALDLENVALGLISTDPLDRLPREVAAGLAAHRQIADCLDPDQLTEAMSSMGPVDRILGPLEELQVPMAQVRERLGVSGLGVEAAANFRDKERMKSVLDAAGVPCARHRLVGSAADLWSFSAEVGYPLVLKPPAGSGSRSTYRLESDEQLAEWMRWNRLSESEPILCEEFMVGREHSFDCVFLGGEPVFWSVSRYYPTPLDVLQNPWIQWAVILPRTLDGYGEIERVGPAAISALGLETGLVHMEWFQRPDGSAAVSEAAVRPPGAQFTTLISHAHEFDLYAAWGRLMILGTFEPPARRYAVGAVYLRGQGAGEIIAIEGLDTAQAEVEGMVVDVRLPPLGTPPSPHYEGDGYVIVRGDETEAVEEAVDAILANVRVLLG